MLFLRHLKTVKWRDERDVQTGFYSCHRRPHDKIQNASEVELIAFMNGDNQPSETFLVFRKEVQPPQEVIADLLRILQKMTKNAIVFNSQRLGTTAY